MICFLNTYTAISTPMYVPLCISVELRSMSNACLFIFYEEFFIFVHMGSNFVLM